MHIHLLIEATAKFGGKEKQRKQIEDISSIVQAVNEGDIQTVKTIIGHHPDAVYYLLYRISNNI